MKITNLKILGKAVNPDIRTLLEMKKVIYDKEWFKKEKPDSSIPLYCMYRGIYKNKIDQKRAQKYKIRYDITVIPPFLMGKEFVKTKGHYHPLAVKKLSYPELYEVLKGESIFLLQERGAAAEVKDLIVLKCKKGDKILVPPNYGHIIINPANKILKTANWISSKFSPLYEEIEKMNGFCYFALKKNSRINWVKNKKYKKVPRIRLKKSVIPPKFQIPASKPIYSLIRTPLILKFLNKPEEYINF